MSQDYNKPFIVKIQRAVAHNGAAGSILVYNEDRSILWEEPESPAMLKLLGNRYKAFYWARVTEGKLEILAGNPARDPEW